MPKRSVTIAGHRTSISLEQEFWNALSEIAEVKGESLAGLIAAVDDARAHDINLSAAIRIYVLEWFRSRAARR
jgi:predicted DNA-binding ribbon-helix-helix protein